MNRALLVVSNSNNLRRLILTYPTFCCSTTITPRFFHLSFSLEGGKGKIPGKKNKKSIEVPSSSQQHESILDDEEIDKKNPVIKNITQGYELAMNEMKVLEEKFVQDLTKHFSLKLDTRAYEEIPVTMENGKTYRMDHLGRVSLHNPQMVMINFTDNPGAIGPAKLVVQKLYPGVNPVQEGITLHIPIPRMTRERREELVKFAEKTIFNHYKNALNKVYSKFDDISRKQSTMDDGIRLVKQLHDFRKKMEEKGRQLIEGKKKEIMKEIA
uniref:Ribosome-recycling factor, mitochondrial n=1 Tax=Acrobeloides nanus TaxID=290746 RepID=A0A914E0C5_9BILA